MDIIFEATADASLESCENLLLDKLEIPLDRVEAISLHLITKTMTALQGLGQQSVKARRLVDVLGDRLAIGQVFMRKSIA
ncbi:MULTISPECIES: hypothetical protein [Halomonas]|uniref:Uncharacterized protein n=1 Tax=Halomonas ventosae TaxID=229007 RepID=A0A4R6HPQ4_9GAMM|nr:hypothetical protein [Halomonas ventosae]TDO10634.1 hypothetical protein DFO68_105159 [Halomonas ventosae]